MITKPSSSIQNAFDDDDFQWPSNPLTEHRFVMLDTETTGLDPEKDRVIELAMRAWRVKDERTLAEKSKAMDERYESLFDPGCKLPPVSMATHHIIPSMLQGAPRLEDCQSEIRRFVGDSIIIAYNADYDKSMMPCLQDKTWIDAQRLAMHVWHIGQENEDGFPLTSFKQQELRYWLGFYEVDGDAHRADADIQVTGLIWNKGIEILLAQGFPDDLAMFTSLMSAPIPHKTMPFGPFAGRCPEELTGEELRQCFYQDGRYYQGYEKFGVLERLRPLIDDCIFQGEKIHRPRQKSVMKSLS